MKKILLIPMVLVLSLTVGGCAETYKSGGVKHKVKKEKVVEKSFGRKAAAKYFYRKPHVKKNGNIYVVGSIDAPGDASPVLCEKAADLQARVELARELSSRIESQMELAAEGFKIKEQTLTQIIKETTAIENLQGVYIDTRYWEKRLVRETPDEYLKYTCFSRAVMPLDAFKKKTDDLLKRYEDEKKVSEGFIEEVDLGWDKSFQPVDVSDDDIVQ